MAAVLERRCRACGFEPAAIESRKRLGPLDIATMARFIMLIDTVGIALRKGKAMELMNIGQAATATGVSAKMIRHYEQVGLLAAPRRTDSGYRQYADPELHTLRFIRHARDLGFSIKSIGELVGLWQNRRRPSRQVKRLAEAQILELEQKARELLAMKATLEHLVHCCHGDDRPDCPILENLAAQGTADKHAVAARQAKHGFSSR